MDRLAQKLKNSGFNQLDRDAVHNAAEMSEPKILSQQTVGELGDNMVDKITLQTEARTKIRAKTKARRHLRFNDEVVKNVLNPSVVDVESTKQGRLVQFFPGDVESKKYTIELLIVKG